MMMRATKACWMPVGSKMPATIGTIVCCMIQGYKKDLHLSN